MSQESKSRKTSIINLKPHQENVHVKVRVLETSPPRVIQTRKGPRTISDALLGDETGRVKATLWGRKAGTLEEGKVIDIEGAWTSSYRGQVQLNIGSSTKVSEIDDSEVPQKEDIPEDMPKAPMEDYRRGHGGFRKRKSFGGRY